MIDTLARLEPFVALGILAIALCAARTSARVWDRSIALARAFASRPRLAVLSCALIGGLGSACFALFVRWPEPSTHDEFAYLLSADTFAHGRLSNPTHPCWRHFETIHVFHVPTYASKYPPGQALLLALGRLIGGEEALGLWIGAAGLAALFTWMLRGWMPMRWALLGGWIGTLHYCIATYWSQTYWGGLAAASGGALVYGALGRAERRPRALHGLLFGAGLGILALSRPFEGLLAVLPAGFVLLARARASRRELRVGPAVIAAAVASCAAFLLWLALYDRAVTGDALRLPYMVHDEQYASAPNFLWLGLGEEPAYRHPAMREYWERFVLQSYLSQQDLAGFASAVLRDARNVLDFHVGAGLALLLVALPWSLGRRGVRLALVTFAVLGLGMLGSTFRLPHYAAPGTSLLLLVLVQCARTLSHWRVRSCTLGQALATAAIVWLLAFHIGQALTIAIQSKRWSEHRAELEANLETAGGKHLVVVRYGPEHSIHEEWVENGADLETAPILWARDMGQAANRELLEHYAGRTIWRLDVGFEREWPRLTPYE